MMKSATNFWSVEAQGDQAIVRSEAEAEIKWGFLGRLLEPLFAIVFRRLGARSLASLKYLVENGRPFQGPRRKLPPIAAGC